jgi:glutamate synthase (NADPH/NADH) small chain
VDGSEFVLPVDCVYRATGQAKYRGFFAGVEGLKVDGGGRVVTSDTGQTSVTGLWAAGDCVNGGKEVVNAVEEGKLAARDIHQTLEAN